MFATLLRKSSGLLLSALLFGSSVNAAADALSVWHPRDGGVSDEFFGLNYCGGLFVITGYFKPVILTSPDGVLWTQHALAPYAYLRSVAWGGGNFVAVGNVGTVWTSPNGADWTMQYLNTSSDFGGVTYGAGRFVAVGGGGVIWSSTNATDWALSAKVESIYLRCVTFANGRFVAAGENGGIFTSTNAFDWTASFSGRIEDIEAIAYGNGLFVGVGNFAQGGRGADFIITSPDGNEWMTRYTNPSQNLTAVAFGNGVFVAGAGQGCLISTNGVKWAPRALAIPQRIYRFAYGRGTFLGAGGSGAIVQSDPLSFLSLKVNGAAELTVSGLDGRAYAIQSSSALDAAQNWSNIVTITLTNGSQTWIDPASVAGHSGQFYRSLCPP